MLGAFLSVRIPCIVHGGQPVHSTICWKPAPVHTAGDADLASMYDMFARLNRVVLIPE